MTEPVTMYNGYYLIDTKAWLDQRVGAHQSKHSSAVQDFVRCDVFDDYRPTMDTAARMHLWCAAQGWQVGAGAAIEHDESCLTKPVTIVLATSTGVAGQALALVSIDGGTPEVYADVTTDDGYWLAVSTIQISCPDGHCWTWDGDGDLHAAHGASARVSELFGPRRTVISRCRQCMAFDDGRTDIVCACPGYGIYCPTCGQRCAVTLPQIPTWGEQ